jgi:hypothetical protein
MSFFSEASLAMIPSGYKTSKVYSALPITGDGDLTFTRSNDTATRVGPNGYIEKVRTNVLTYSQDFSNANWVGFDVSRTGSQTDPNGGTTASLYTSLTNSANVSANFSTVSSSPYTLSIYIKGTTSGIVSLRVDSGSTAAQNNISYTTAWQRFTYTFTAGASTSTVVLGGYASFTTGEEIYVAFAQAELGDIATDYIATTSAAVTVGPVANVPRLDYLDSSSPRLLLEPQRTNLTTYSEQLDNAAWTKNAATITANASVSPDGTTNADTLTESTFTSDSAFIYETVVVTASTAYTTTFFVKQGAGRYVYLRNYYGAGNAYHTIVVDTQTGTITQASVGSSITNASSSIEAYGNGWYRVRATQTSAVEIALLPIIGLSDTATPTVGTFGQITIASNAGRSASVWGCQLEAGAYATSYIPTLGASVTRGADAASKTGISSLIGQTEGTIFAEINFDLGVTAQGDSRIQLSDGTASNWIFIGLPDGASGNLIRMYVNTPSSSMTAYSTNPVVNGVNKIAFGYKSGSFVLYVNGVQAATSSTTLTMATCSRIDLQGSVPAESAQERTNYKQLLLFTSRLSNDDLASLTTI